MDSNPEFMIQISTLKDLTQLSNTEVLTPVGIQDWGGAICTISHKKINPTIFAKKLMEDHRIFTVGIEHAVVNGIRITPHLSTTVKDCIKLNEALFEMLSK
jgi:selenocysteine lyase/cysteine desulfurase